MRMQIVYAMALLMSLVGCTKEKQPTAQVLPPATEPTGVVLSGPYTHENLTIWLVHGKDTLPDAKYLTLQEAMESKQLVVHETSNVNELSVENTSDQPVYIQAGEIVKGGKQDRTMGTDLVVKAHSGKMPIDAFCVEHGRWTARGGESAQLFGSSNNMIAGSSMKFAANANLRADDVQISSGFLDSSAHAINAPATQSSQQLSGPQTGYVSDLQPVVGQSAVWRQAQKNQEKLSGNLSTDVASSTSPSSFQLTVENKAVQEKTDAFKSALISKIDGKQDVIGWVYAINGQVTGANVYGAGSLFKKLWPKLLESGAIEAIAEKQEGKTFEIASNAQVEKFLSQPRAMKRTNRNNDRTRTLMYDANDSVLLQTDDDETGDAVHRSYLKK